MDTKRCEIIDKWRIALIWRYLILLLVKAFSASSPKLPTTAGTQLLHTGITSCAVHNRSPTIPQTANSPLSRCSYMLCFRCPSLLLLFHGNCFCNFTAIIIEMQTRILEFVCRSVDANKRPFEWWRAHCGAKRFSNWSAYPLKFPDTRMRLLHLNSWCLFVFIDAFECQCKCANSTSSQCKLNCMNEFCEIHFSPFFNSKFFCFFSPCDFYSI